jgi:hypothetical protein
VGSLPHGGFRNPNYAHEHAEFARTHVASRQPNRSFQQARPQAGARPASQKAAAQQGRPADQKARPQGQKEKQADQNN